MLAEFKIGDKVRHSVLLRVQKIGTSSNGGVFARGVIQDVSGSINFISFENRIAEYLKECSSPSVFTVYGTIDSNKYANDGSLQMVITQIDVPNEDEDLSHLLPYTPKNIEEYKNRLTELIDGIKRPALKQLVNNIFSGNVYLRFIKNPAAMSYHHAYVGGLLEHSVDVANLAKAIAAEVGDVDLDIIVVGALLHDIGKIYEISSSIGFNYTEAGRLMGHITLGVIMVEREISKIEAFSLSDEQHLIHILLAHHGTIDKGSPVACSSKESFVVHYADELNAILNQFDSANEKNDWQYNKMLNRHILINKGEKII